MILPPTRLDGRVLVVGGSEAGGGTGILADVKTLTALGAHGTAAVVAVGVHRLPPDLVAGQMRSVLAETGADCLKIGAPADAAAVAAIADVLDGEARGLPLVLEAGDTTMPLMRFARLAVVAAAAPGAADLVRAARAALLVSDGGDVLSDGPTQSVFARRRMPPHPVESIVSTLAAAIAAGLAQRLPLAAAVRRGRDYVQEAILTAPEFGRGARPLNHAHTVRPFPTDTAPDS